MGIVYWKGDKKSIIISYVSRGFGENCKNNRKTTLNLQNLGKNKTFIYKKRFAKCIGFANLFFLRFSSLFYSKTAKKSIQFCVFFGII